jgi:hypothetical protein
MENRLPFLALVGGEAINRKTKKVIGNYSHSQREIRITAIFGRPLLVRTVKGQKTGWCGFIFSAL